MWHKKNRFFSYFGRLNRLKVSISQTVFRLQALYHEKNFSMESLKMLQKYFVYSSRTQLKKLWKHCLKIVVLDLLWIDSAIFVNILGIKPIPKRNHRHRIRQICLFSVFETEKADSGKCSWVQWTQFIKIAKKKTVVLVNF